LVTEVLLTVKELSEIYKRSQGSIRTALWRHRHFGIDPGVPLPMLIRGKYCWFASVVAAHLQELHRLHSQASPDQAVAPKPQAISEEKEGDPPET
jgi:hypothetical protein